MCLDKFGEAAMLPVKQVERHPNRRQLLKGSLRRRQRDLKRQLETVSEAERPGLQELLTDLKRQILVISRAENQRKRRKRKRKARQSFYKNPYAFAKKLFSETKSGTVDVPQTELQAHLEKTYSDPLKNIPLDEINNIPQPSEPGINFDLSKFRLHEIRDFVRKARSKSAPGMNGISYKLYKNCPNVLKQLACLLQRAWNQGVIPQSWCLADGIWIPKEKNAKGIGNFRPISLLNIEGKIFFGVLARRLTNFLMNNNYINTAVQKAGIPGFPGCLEHAQMIWNSIQRAKKQKKEIHVVWLDLANAYGSVPHSLIRKALKFFHVPQKAINVIMKYFNAAFMRFSTQGYVTDWQALEIGIMMGCVISALLFVMTMELILRGAENSTKGEQLETGLVLPPSKAFMDDITTVIQSKAGTISMLDRLYELFSWARMKVKSKKSRSLSIVKGGIRQIHFTIGGDEIPTVKDQPVKSLGRLYTKSLSDRSRSPEIEKLASDGLKSINKSELPGKLKAWCFQHGLLPRLMWPLQVYEVPLSRVEKIQVRVNKSLRKWLGVPPCFSTLGLYTKSGALQLPFSSIVEEFKVSKARLHLMMRDSPDQIIQQTNPEIRTGTKWSASTAVQEAECSLKIKDIMGITQTGRAGLGFTTPSHQWFSNANPKTRRNLVINELHSFEEEKRKAIAVGQAKQCAWSSWRSVEPRKLGWPTLFAMEPLLISFLMRATYDLLPTEVNLKLWGLKGTDVCPKCQNATGTLRHVLSACKQSLDMYTWRHNQVLEILVDLVKSHCSTINSKDIESQAAIIHFHKEGQRPSHPHHKVSRLKLLSGANDWKVAADLSKPLSFPSHIAITNERPDIVIWSDSTKRVILAELTVPWEDNMEEAYERKKTRYEPLKLSCEDRGWTCQVFPLEVGCRGFIGRSTMSFLSKTGFTGRPLKMASKHLQSTAERASAWIWSRSRTNSNK